MKKFALIVSLAILWPHSVNSMQYLKFLCCCEDDTTVAPDPTPYYRDLLFDAVRRANKPDVEKYLKLIKEIDRPEKLHGPTPLFVAIDLRKKHVDEANPWIAIVGILKNAGAKEDGYRDYRKKLKETRKMIKEIRQTQEAARAKQKVREAHAAERKAKVAVDKAQQSIRQNPAARSSGDRYVSTTVHASVLQSPSTRNSYDVQSDGQRPAPRTGSW